MYYEKAQSKICTVPLNAPEWLKKCYQIIIETRYEPQETTLEKAENLLENKPAFEVNSNINMLNKHDTNLLWAAAICGKYLLVKYLIKEWGMDKKILTEKPFDFGIFGKCNIIKMAGFLANMVDIDKRKKKIEKNKDLTECFDYLKTMTFLMDNVMRKSTGLQQNFTKPTIIETILGGSIKLTIPSWLQKEFDTYKSNEQKTTMSLLQKISI